MKRLDTIATWATSAAIALVGSIAMVRVNSPVGRLLTILGVLVALAVTDGIRHAVVNRLSPVDPIPAGWTVSVLPRFVGDTDWFVGYRAKAWETDPSPNTEGPMDGWCWTQRSARQQVAWWIQEEIERQADRAAVSS